MDRSKKRRRRVTRALVLVALAFCSCRMMPPLAPEIVRDVTARFEASLPAQFDARQTLVFEYRPHWWWPSVRMTALGYATVNRLTRDFTVVCLSPLGVRLFDVTRTNGQVRANIMVGVSIDSEVLGQAIADDIASLYFDLVPARDAEVMHFPDRIVFRSGVEELEFSVSTGELLRKTVRADGRSRTVTFADYHRQGDWLYPAHVVLRNDLHRYQVEVLTRDLRVSNASSSPR